ncbi:error-prone DNA polymerase [Bradyrhizobium sp. U87765 SZCCT0131]|uniref:error-prone DNA polymerase n=1 Tax=unclassified Bradyrhizobium TaxID=2631580 RepID=UPI001BA47F7A|nr:MULTISPECIES: error-prone DNA polymerase [unclassified Bradyrhizobium]MBR1221462.1 error-prone DNA polymerase [Bradyrhizobium sp. U87765 SZCCT0131]MBR1264615.1 error-prone DNA polymerase [Bradyrhizobium sp. U87765 SZCCT0134]MBR1304479.1 error-prone DNA polymerase [Bradyrhizobium sp. U87765 SZCCT0110]MBR1322664.1 error-prone DNA polymerase [Bradyrhizobium sp. U87765 SZCCT0109]MBR1346408.1 error-prone DNA polymerase [Bradyrhizobium sp. U87765 SZCCT0048]
MSYAELEVTSHFSFLRGASSAEELFATAALLGIPALGITDRNTLAGIVRAHEAARTTGVRLVVGCRLDLEDFPSLLVYPVDRAGYGRLSRLLTLGKARAGKGKCSLSIADVEAWSEGSIAVLVSDLPGEALDSELRRLRSTFGDRAYCSLTRRFRPNDAARLRGIAEAAARAGVPTVVTGDVLYHEAGRRMLHDVMTCIRLKTTIDRAGFLKERHADRFLKLPQEVARLFQPYPEAVARSLEIAARCRFSLDELAYTYPREGQDGLSAQELLEKLTFEGAAQRYPESAPDAVVMQLRHELSLIEKMGYAPYFLTVDSIVRFARSRGILCQGRGSAANSAVCFVLGVTSIDPVRQGLLFERFVSEERREPPDIDVDFEHERREEVIQWIYQTYGRTRSALAATVARYRSRGAVREVGKALGVPEDITGALARLVWGWSEEGVTEAELRELNLNPSDRRLRLTLELARQLIGTPRHLSQHPGGFVLTHDRLDEMVPIEPAAMELRQVIEWDKDDLEAVGLMKVDVLGLGMLGCMRRAFDLLKAHKGIELDLATIPAEDPDTYAMIQRADTVGVFQIESRAQMSMLPRMKPSRFYDLVIEVAIVRPGPIQGDMVHPYLRRREGKEAVVYPTPELEKVLGKTLGVPLFQEQAMQVAMVAAGFSASEADQLRRAMATFKFTGGVNKFRHKLVQGMIDNGYTRDFADRTFRQLEGFGSYGFPESHAASFALIAYASSWMKCHHPDVFCAALLNAQPMGFYHPAQLVRDARQDAVNHGVAVRPIDINASEWDCTLEPLDGGRHAVRLGLRMARGLAEKDGRRMVEMRGGAYRSILDLARRSSIPVAAMVQLARADAYSSLGLSRREAYWAIKALRNDSLPLFAAADRREGHFTPDHAEPEVALDPMSGGREVVEDYRSVGLSLRAHPVSFLREELGRRGILPCSALRTAKDGCRITVAGLVLVRQMPGSAKGVMFITLEDETDIANLIVWPSLFDKQRRIILGAQMMACRGKVQSVSGVIHVVGDYLIDQSELLNSVGGRDGKFTLPAGRGDEARHGGSGVDSREPKTPPTVRPRDIYIPDLHIDTLKVKARNFR